MEKQEKSFNFGKWGGLALTGVLGAVAATLASQVGDCRRDEQSQEPDASVLDAGIEDAALEPSESDAG